MKILAIHADFIEFQAKKKAFKQAEEGILEAIARYGQERFRSFSVQNNSGPFIERFETIFS